MSKVEQAQRKLLTMAEVAALMRTPENSLRYWRHQGTGPASFKVGRRVVYDEAVVLAWIEEQRQASTSGGAA